MTAVRDELEHALATRWDRDTLAVYADHLQSLDDPRGELIAIDLQIEAGGRTDELVERRTALLCDWLGAPEPVDIGHRPWVGDAVRFGFVEDLVLTDDGRTIDVSEARTSPAWEYLRSVTIQGDAAHIEHVLAAITDERCAMLDRLVVTRYDGSEPIAAPLCSRLIAATPVLQTLDLRGWHLFDAFPHPAVRRLRIEGWDALAGLFGTPQHGLEHVDDLDLAWIARNVLDERWTTVDQLRSLLGKLALPALRRLDLSRNGSFSGTVDRPPDSPFPLLTAIPQREQLTHLRLPGIGQPADYELLADAVREMPALLEVEVVRSHYFAMPPLPHPTARFTPPPRWPWPPPDRLHGVTLVLRHGNDEHEHALDGLAGRLEVTYERMPPDEQAAWRELWAVLDQLRGTDERSISTLVLLRAFKSYWYPEAWPLLSWVVAHGDPRDVQIAIRRA